MMTEDELHNAFSDSVDALIDEYLARGMTNEAIRAALEGLAEDCYEGFKEPKSFRHGGGC